MPTHKRIPETGRVAALWNSVPSFRRQEEGVASVGAVIWVPFFMGLTALALDASLLFMHRGDMWRTSGEVARQLALGSITEAEAQAFVEDYSLRGADYTVAVTSTSDAVSAALSIPINQISITAWFANSAGNISVQATHRLDP